jgi:adenylosuccinate lyase
MTAIWSQENKYRKWLDVEVAACEAMVQLGKVPAAAVENIKAKAVINVDRIDEIEKVTKHDVIAFVSSLTEVIGDDGRFIHMGLDVLGCPGHGACGSAQGSLRDPA